MHHLRLNDEQAMIGDFYLRQRRPTKKPHGDPGVDDTRRAPSQSGPYTNSVIVLFSEIEAQALMSA